MVPFFDEASEIYFELLFQTTVDFLPHSLAAEGGDFQKAYSSVLFSTNRTPNYT